MLILLYHFLDWFFVIFHTVFIFFNVFAWIYKPLRKWNLLTLILTAASWFLLGIFYGWGYCFLTHWHWEILYKLGNYPMESSYVQYLFRRLMNLTVSADFADNLTAGVFFAALIISIAANIRDLINLYRKKSNNF
jgi:hypothetical protein